MPSRPSINLSVPSPPIVSGHLPMGGTAPDGTTLGVNSRYLTLNGTPWLPVMGEFHYSRVPREQWEAELRKCKAGGLDIIACYNFWIHHEEVEGEFDFTGCRDVGEFVRLCRELGLWVWLRLGPWAHGECRNGGLPDWVIEKGVPTRQDHPEYLDYVRRLWTQLFAQVDGHFFAQGGPIIGIQLENELMQNAQHLSTLKKLAQEIGFVTPYATVTGWGDVHVPEDEVLPVFGGYADGFWERSSTDWPLRYRKNFFFRHTRNDTSIGNDLVGLQQEGEPVDPARYPYLTCETGGGMPSAFHRRIYLDPMDTVALAYVMVGSCSNLQGYYMYHGGNNPVGKHSTLQESQSTGYPNDVPVKAYFPDSPLGDFGQVNPTFHPLRRLHQFLRDWGSRLAPMASVLPSDLPPQLEDCSTLRWAFRGTSDGGFLFVNNHQRIEPLPDHSQVQFDLHGVEVPNRPIDIPAGACFLLPVGQPLGSLTLLNATVQPFAILEDRSFVFTEIAGVPPEIVLSPTDAAIDISGGMIETAEHGLILRPHQGEILCADFPGGEQIWIIPATIADEVNVVCGRLLRSPALVVEASYGFGLQAIDLRDLWVQDLHTHDIWRAEVSPTTTPQVSVSTVQEFSQIPELTIGEFEVVQVPEEEAFDQGTWIDIDLNDLNDEWRTRGWIEVHYVGSLARAEVEGQLITDNFWNGEPWKIGLNLLPTGAKQLRIKILPVRASDPIYFELNARKQLTLEPQVTLKAIHLGRYYYAEVNP